MFDAPVARPVANAIGWIEGMFLGQTAVALCVIAVAIVGFFMLTGRLPIRQAARVVLGCFVLLNAAFIGGELAGIGGEGNVLGASVPGGEPRLLFERAPLPPAEFDPYAGASLRRE